MPWGVKPGGAGQPEAVPAAATPASVTTAAARRSHGPPARAGRPSTPSATTAIPARNIIRAIGRSGR